MSTQPDLPAFQGFPEDTVRFFLDLRFHNDMTWFHAHHHEYETYVREPFYSFIDHMAPAMLQIADDLELRPARCLARINRDIRFAKDKSPYRDHLWLLFRRAGEERDRSVMYWFELSPEQVQWGLGFWGQNRPAMDVLRLWMETQPSKVIAALNAAKLSRIKMAVFGECYARKKVPEAVPTELHELYGRKEIYIQRLDTHIRYAYSPDLADRVSRDFLQLKPMYHLLREAADLAATGFDH